MSILPSNLLATSVDYVALRGNEGISLEELFSCIREDLGECIDNYIEMYIWKHLLRIPELFIKVLFDLVCVFAVECMISPFRLSIETEIHQECASLPSPLFLDQVYWCADGVARKCSLRKYHQKRYLSVPS